MGRRLPGLCTWCFLYARAASTTLFAFCNLCTDDASFSLQRSQVNYGLAERERTVLLTAWFERVKETNACLNAAIKALSQLTQLRSTPLALRGMELNADPLAVE